MNNSFVQFLRLFWICCLIAIILSTLSGLKTCDDGWVILTYLFLSIFVSALAVLVEAFLMVTALRVMTIYISAEDTARNTLSQGTIVDAAPRQGMGRLINYHAVLGVVQLLCAIFG
jgi:hypothetical protein